MATTRIMPLHVGKGRTESRAISDIIDYVANPQKTDNGRLIAGFACDSRTVDAEFLLAKRQYKDAMRMRDVSPSLGGFLSHPGMTVECIYVPLMMMASKAADELSIASVTRGIENPNPRTCLVQIKCGIADWMAMLIAVAFFIFELWMRGGVTG